MQYPSKYKTTTATGQRNVFNLSHSLITTNDFGIIKPVFMRMMVPGDRFEVKVDSFTRLMPMPCPTYGKIDIVTRGFFVPCRILMRHFNDFIANQLVSDGTNLRTIPRAPFIKSDTIVKIFNNTNNGFTTSDTNGKFIITLVKSGGVLEYHKFKLTPKGRRVYDMLNSLGCRFPWVYRENTSSTKFDALSRPIEINALPLLGLCKFYIDWIVPSRFLYEYKKTLDILEHEHAVQGGVEYNIEETIELLKPFYSYHADDYFTSGFINPFGYEVSQASSIYVPNPADNSPDEPYFRGVYVSENSDNPDGASVETGQDDSYINYFTLQTLGALQHMVNNGKLAGTKVQDYMRTTYGIDIDPALLNISTYLGSHRSTIQIGDVMAQAGTEQNKLGEFAGKGLGGASNEKFTYETKEHGYFFVTSEILVTPSYVDGLAHEFLMNDRLDFFAVPELDNLGVEAISHKEINADIDFFTVPSTATVADINKIGLDGIFAFAPRNARFKVGFDRLSGDFRDPSQNENLKSWYLARNFGWANRDVWQAINSQFCQADTDQQAQNYDYIFSVANNGSDHFYQIFHIDVKAIRPMQTIAEALEVDHRPKNGKDVTVNLNSSVE